MKTTHEIKEIAKANLGNKIFGEVWIMAVVAYLIEGAIVSAAGTITEGVGLILVTGPLTCGLQGLFLKNSRTQQKMDIGEMFKPFKEDLGGVFLLGLLMDVFITLWSLLFIIPGIIKAYSWSMAYYIKADHPEYSWKQCMDTSAELMKGHKMQLFMQDLSFLGWMILGSLCFGIGILWAASYCEAARAVFYQELKNEQVLSTGSLETVETVETIEAEDAEQI